MRWFGYIGTNAILLEKEKIQWLSKNFDLIGISCDGPPDIQDIQRPAPDNNKSSQIVKQFARTIYDSKGQLEVRSTITPLTMKRQTEIVSYLCNHLYTAQIRFEPAYRQTNKGQLQFAKNHAEIFAENFLAAQNKANIYGCNLSYSGARLEEFHSSYCNILRDVLHLIPNGNATACFFCVDSNQSDNNDCIIGRYYENKCEFLLDQNKLFLHKKNVCRIPVQCKKCINIYHCNRGCPDLCFHNYNLDINKKKHMKQLNAFRCRLNKYLSVKWILHNALSYLNVNDDTKKEKQNAYIENKDVDIIKKYLFDMPSRVDVDSILINYKAIKQKYHIEENQLPLPVWSGRDFENTGEKAWEKISNIISSQNSQKPLSIYIHIPFCENRCSFCDCYSIPLGKKKNYFEERFLKAFIHEMNLWAQIPELKNRDVTTVHLGGGTPNCLSIPVFETIISKCIELFNIHAETELAIESTSRLISESHLNMLKKNGFSRIHIGVQTLNDSLRKQIGRKDDKRELLHKLILCLNMGFITSVDLIYGLPNQTIQMMIDTIEELININVHGFSIYRFNVSKRNSKLLKKYNSFCRDKLFDYILLQISEQLLENAGYSKNHFAHFSRPEDLNLYFTHTLRYEDLLAIGPTASGMFGNYHYLNSNYASYIKLFTHKSSLIKGGLFETKIQKKTKKLVSELMGGIINLNSCEEIINSHLVEEWQKLSLIRKSSTQNDTFLLTANGSWFINWMICEVENYIKKL